MVKYIWHNSKKILLCDYSNCKTIEEQLKVLQESEDAILQANLPYLDLTNFSHAKATKEFMSKAKEVAKNTGHLMKKGAIVVYDMSIARRILLDTYNALLGGGSKLKSFANMEDAMDYLTR